MFYGDDGNTFDSKNYILCINILNAIKSVKKKNFEQIIKASWIAIILF